MKQKRLLLSYAALLMLVMTCYSCNNWLELGARRPEYPEYTFLPGESLRSSVLSFEQAAEVPKYYYKSKVESEALKDYPDSGKLLILFFQVDYEYQRIKDKYTHFWHIPTDAAFEQFGENTESIKNEFNSIAKNSNITSWSSADLCTVYFESGYTLTADKEFAGFAPGTDLSPIMVLLDWGVPSFDIPGDSGMEDAQMVQRRLAFCFAVGNHDMVKEYTSFNLSVPVKVGMYLNWINDSLSDKNAVMHYKDEVLTCSFTTNKRF